MNVKQILINLGAAVKDDSWICSDLSVTKSSFFGRVFWKVFAKHFSVTRRFFYNIDLETSRRKLIDLKARVEKNKSLARCFSCAVAAFNRIAPQHSVDDIGAQQRAIELLNSPNPSLEALLNIITQQIANFRIYVEEPTGASERKKYVIATKEQSEAPPTSGHKQAGDMPTPVPTDNHTTTLANIIATNELHRTPEEVSFLIQKLIEVRADFSAVDYTDFQGSPSFSSIQNNPLKSVIVLGSCNNDYDQTISLLLSHIRSLSSETQYTILSQADRYPARSMSHLYLLIRQGKEALALQVLQCNTPIKPEDLILACWSFGTVRGKETNQEECIRELYKRLSASLSEAERAECLEGLNIFDQKWLSQQKARLQNTSRNWPDDSWMCRAIVKELQIKPEQLSTTPPERVLRAYGAILASQVHHRFHQDFHDEFRPTCTVSIPETKLAFMLTPQGERLRSDLVDLFNQPNTTQLTR